MKKRCILIFLIQLLIMNLFGQSIADFTLIHIPTGKMINYYDSPELLFNILNKTIDLGEEIPYVGNSGFKKISFPEGYICIDRISLNQQKGLIENLKLKGVKYPNDYFSIYSISVKKDFKTPRGIQIGSTIEEVIIAYPEIVLYNDENDIWNKNNIVSKDKLELAKCLVLSKKFYQHNRYIEMNYDLDYFLIFHLDKNQNVKSIVLWADYNQP